MSVHPFTLIALTLGPALFALASSASTLVHHEKRTMRTVFDDSVQLQVPECWEKIEVGDGAGFKPDKRKCPKDAGSPFEIWRSKNLSSKNAGASVYLVEAKDVSSDSVDCLSHKAKIEAKRPDLTIGCASPPEATEFSAAVVCGEFRYEIKYTEHSLKFDGRSKIKPDELPDKPYKAAFRTLRCVKK